ncbi:unnamed protein product [Chondrus crispus]|uniref:Leucine carboxyl methyltransferase 1 n=1 Tax=Chondrus crispus TaxID=2769 RepID=R7QPI9_CHOCR|nr:unnamed protein product [Chondrus crispus]CDF40407.1 unnamed protein product [Chondrus crispus]|eukprot:XP_005710701.1 unnamed protein product [Chondrus crispus]
MHPRASRQGHSVETADSDVAVRATNDDALESKYCAMHAGYFEDAFLDALASHLLRDDVAPPSRPPLINRGTAARVAFKSDLIHALLGAAWASSETVQIVSLGAGYDSLPFSLFEMGQSMTKMSLHYVELDFAPIVQAKAAAVEAQLVLRGLFRDIMTDGESLQGIVKGGTQSRYVLSAFDLRDTPRISDVLRATGLKCNCPTIILAEIVLVYLDPVISDAVIREIGHFFTRERAFVNIEHSHPHDSFGLQMVKNIAARGSPLLGISKYPTLAAQKSRFVREGWPCVEALTMLQGFQRKFSTEEALNLNRIEHLDEIEEWDMLMEHYGIVIAIRWSGEDDITILEDVLKASFGRAGETSSTNRKAAS